jgi:biotin synthase
MPDINIAATTALQVLHPEGREMAVLAGANIIMPNMTLPEHRSDYLIYEHKPGVHDDAALSKSKLEQNLQNADITIGYGEWGDSQHFAGKTEK